MERLSGGGLMRHQAIWDAARHTLGVDEIDHAHQAFIGQVAALIAASDAEFPALFQALINHTREHFMAEGQLMRASKYQGLAMHEGEHHRVLGELQQLNRTLKRGRLPLVRAFVKQGLPEWFDNHLTMMDGALTGYLKQVQSMANPSGPGEEQKQP
jgi:hemerythrin-like metal-binding protein